MDREELIQAIDEAMRLAALQREQLTQALAESLGIPSSDLECLELAYSRGGVTVGELAAARSVTVGAISQCLNRLEARGLSRRETDPTDRRRTIVRARAGAVRRIAPVFGKLREAMTRECSPFSDEELQIARKILSQCAGAFSEQTRIVAAKPLRHLRPKVTNNQS
jgi:DNA-binding MarR family transcriptional regulator